VRRPKDRKDKNDQTNPRTSHHRVPLRKTLLPLLKVFTPRPNRTSPDGLFRFNWESRRQSQGQGSAGGSNHFEIVLNASVDIVLRRNSDQYSVNVAESGYNVQLLLGGTDVRPREGGSRHGGWEEGEETRTDLTREGTPTLCVAGPLHQRQIGTCISWKLFKGGESGLTDRNSSSVGSFETRASRRWSSSRGARSWFLIKWVRAGQVPNVKDGLNHGLFVRVSGSMRRSVLTN